MFGDIAGDGGEIRLRHWGQLWSVSWHPPGARPTGRDHGAAGVCLARTGELVLIRNGEGPWDLPAGRPEPGEDAETVLRREVLEEACARVVTARLLGYSRGRCLEGHEAGLVLVRSFWRAEVELDPWEPRFETTGRMVVPPGDGLGLLDATFRPLFRRALVEAGLEADPRPAIRIRPMEPADAEVVAALALRCFDEVMAKAHSPAVIAKFRAHQTPDTYRDQLHWKHMVVAIMDGDVVGTCALADFGNGGPAKWSVSNCYVSPECQGRGVGKALMGAIIREARARGAGRLHCPASRTGLGFYRSLGFTLEAMQPDAADEVTWLALELPPARPWDAPGFR